MVIDTHTMLSTVPPARLGALLSSRRRQLGTSLRSLSAQSDGVFSARDLKLLERGKHRLDDMTIELLASLYSCESGPIVPTRYRLIIDLDQGVITSGGSSTSLPRTEGSEILTRYLAFVYVMRDCKPGTKIELRSDDINVLAEALEMSRSSVRLKLNVLMTSPEVDERSRSIGKRVSISSAGLLVGFTSLGALVLTPVGAGAAPGMFGEGDNLEPVTVSETVLPGIAEAIPETTITVTHSVDHGQSNDKPTSTADTPPTDAPPTDAPPTDDKPSGSGSSTASPSDVSSSETETSPQPKPSRPEQLGQDAESLISYDWKTHLPDWNVTYAEPRAELRGLTMPGERRIVIYVRSNDTAASVADVLAHELGHALDISYNTNQDRLAWLEARQMPHVWWAGDAAPDFAVGQGDFAEAVATFMLDSSSQSHYGSFTPEQLALVQEMLP